jgi:hypothetical protein
MRNFFLFSLKKENVLSETGLIIRKTASETTINNNKQNFNKLRRKVAMRGVTIKVIVIHMSFPQDFNLHELHFPH